MNKKLIRWSIWILILFVLLLGVSILSLCIGATPIHLKKIVHTIFKGKNSIEHTILFGIRLPRILLGFAIGGALSLSGAILQGMFRNPLVEPYTLGISGGAGLGVCIGIILKLNYTIGVFTLPIFGFIGAFLVILLIYSLSIRKGVLKIKEMLLIGVMISFICSSLIMLIMAVSRADNLRGIIFWVMGSLDEPSSLLIKISLFGSIAGLIASYFFCLDLNALELGEEEALHLGIDVERTKRILFVLTSILTGLSISVAGIIGFVGLIVPHFVRMFLGKDYRILLAGSFLSGAIFLILCDTIARIIIAPLELPVGVVTGILGGILFIYALSKRQVKL